MTVKELKNILSVFNEDLEIRIGGVFEDSSFKIDDVKLGKEHTWRSVKLESGKTGSVSYDEDVVRIESNDVHTLEEDALGEDI